jgi:single-stranded-DNA-specific exonuclease
MTAPPEPTLWHDGPASIGDLTLDLLESFEALAPWGREFDPPTFVVQGLVDECRAIGTDKTHIKLVLADPETGCFVDAVWFRALEAGQAVGEVLGVGDAVAVLARPQINRWRDRESVQLLVEDLRPLESLRNRPA